MADRPFGPYGNLTKLDPDAPPVRGPLVDAGVLEEALLYRACFRVSDGRLSPRDVDQLTFWEAAVVLGVDTPEFPADKTDQQAASGHPNSSHRERAAELNRQRLAHARGQGPAPEAQPVDSSTLNQMSAALR